MTGRVLSRRRKILKERMLQIRLSKGPSTEGGGGVVRPLLAETVTVACPDHLVLADLPVAKGIGSITVASVVKTVGRRSRRHLGERVHFCVRCDYPIAVYGRLSPCEHAFCLECARSESICYLCDERIQKIQTIKMMEGIFICAAPHCLKSFLKRNEFEYHIHESHADLLQPYAEKEDGKESEIQSANHSSASDSTLRAPTRPVFSPASSSQRQQPREQLPPRPIMQQKGPPIFGQAQNYPLDTQLDNNRTPGYDRLGPHNRFQQSFDTPQQESSQLTDKQQGILSETQLPEYPPMHSQPPNYVMPTNQNPVMPPSFGLPSFQTDGVQQFYTASYEMGRTDSTPEVGSQQGSLLGFPPGPVVGVHFSAQYQQSWTAGTVGVPFEAPMGNQGVQEGFANLSDSQGKAPFFQGDFGRNSGLPMIPPPSGIKGIDVQQDNRDGKGILASQSLQIPPPPPPPPHLSHPSRGQFYSGDMGRDGQSYGWQHESHDGFAGSQDQKN